MATFFFCCVAISLEKGEEHYVEFGELVESGSGLSSVVIF